MKTLEQIEPRTIITGLPFAITRSGSYYLTNDLAVTQVTGGDLSGIAISADNVSVDLNGFSLLSTAGLDNGITVATPVKNFALRHGTIRGWDIAVLATNASNSQFEDLRVYGSQSLGLAVGDNSAIRNCVFEANAGAAVSAGAGAVLSHCAAKDNNGDGFVAGVAAVITACSAKDNWGQGFDAGRGSTLSACSAEGNGGLGFYLSTGTTLTGCSAANNTDSGFDVAHGSTITACSAYYNGGVGISAGVNCLIKNCTAYYGDVEGIQVDGGCLVLENVSNENGTDNNPASGIDVQGSGNRIEGNQLYGNIKYGLLVRTNGNLIIRNSARGSSVLYSIPTGNEAGPIGSAATATSPWANIRF
jgi:hypothetical protein